jgi:hypothetical protein
MRAHPVLYIIVLCFNLGRAGHEKSARDHGCASEFGGNWRGHGGGYLAVRAATSVDPGDQVMVGPKGQARLVYPDGCAVDVNPGSVTVVGAESPCARQAAAGFPVDGALAAAGALGAVGGGIAAGMHHAGQIQAPFFVISQPVSP